MYKQDLGLNNPHGLICPKTNQSERKTKEINPPYNENN